MRASAAAVAELLGGPRILGTEVETDYDLAQVVEKGLPPTAIEALVAHHALQLDELWNLVLPRRTWLYRKARRQRLTGTESDRASRVARVAALATQTFGRADLAHQWLRRPSRALGGRIPLALLRTDAGSRLVEDELLRIDDGVYA
jgi:putative toxin-antitoxin system antitoxin component (TIGR02293 family)